jgi:hypothetical protein
MLDTQLLQWVHIAFGFPLSPYHFRRLSLKFSAIIQISFRNLLVYAKSVEGGVDFEAKQGTWHSQAASRGGEMKTEYRN